MRRKSKALMHKVSGRSGGCRETPDRPACAWQVGPRQGTDPLSYQLLRPVGCLYRTAAGLAMPRRGRWVEVLRPARCSPSPTSNAVHAVDGNAGHARGNGIKISFH
jgi:hypothetical protein